MTEIGEIGIRKRRSRQEIKRLVTEFESSGLRRNEFCQKHNLALGKEKSQRVFDDLIAAFHPVAFA